MTFMDPEKVLQLAMLASHLSGYSMPLYTQPPTVFELSTQDMHRFACETNVAVDDACFNDVGVYHDGGDIGVDVQWLQGVRVFDEDTVVVHELTHWLQWVHGQGGTQCPHLQWREDQAYGVQNTYARVYKHFSYQQPPAVACSVEVTIR